MHNHDNLVPKSRLEAMYNLVKTMVADRLSILQDELDGITSDGPDDEVANAIARDLNGQKAHFENIDLEADSIMRGAKDGH